MIDKREITPELLSRLTVLLFTKISAQDVLEERISFNKISCKDIVRVMMEDDYFSKSQSRLGCEAYAKCVIDYVTQKTSWLNGRPADNTNSLNAFDLLLLTLKDLLVMNQNEIECNYEEIFSWRMLVQFMGEELALSARYALWDYEHEKTERDTFDAFTWPYVTAHNNKQLKTIIHRGVSDHHCHLWGSTPYFHVSWVNLMNRLTNSQYQKNLQRLEANQWSSEVTYKRCKDASDEGLGENYGVVEQLRAAWIRLYLCEHITGSGTKAQECTPLTSVRYYANWRRLLLCQSKLQAALESYAYYAGKTADYALAIARLKRTNFASDYASLIGERWLYYRVFTDYCKPFRQRRLSNNDYNLFFAYFLIRLQVRSRMVQNDEFIGFDHFQQIERRKAFFLGDYRSERSLTRLLINETLKKRYILELEVRITPNADQLRRLERAVNAEADENRYYYVFHFLKQNDPSVEGDASYNRSLKSGRICRHDDLRRKVMQQAKEIIRLREHQPLLARRVFGIDAASQEIGCRPEVFGTVYRLLGEHQFSYGGYTEDKKQLPALGKTYHVGEDFVDVVDGLRAIDEVIHFLDFDCGDRLGHAMALGVNVEEWYEQKHREISIPIQDYLDNLAWLYHALNHYFVPNVDALKERITRDFEYWFRIVYRNSIDYEQAMKWMLSAREEWYNRTDEDHDRYHEHSFHFDIMDYYRAWTLRGDDPSCYVDGYFKKPSGSSVMIPGEKCKINEKFPPRYEDRYVAEYSFLNYSYQFNERVRREGARRIKVDISSEYIRAVKAVQIEMRYYIARSGISIETNPTSNVLIGTFRKYEKHPLLTFYNRSLPVTESEERECAQLHVSINTDDSGVFYTDLELEYALLARSVEKIVDENDVPRFKKNDIYTWLDNVRVMGNDQTFRNL